jgi:hypothetical protein
MARGPYQGTWQPNVRPTIAHAPDAVVLINGETDVIGCPSCRKKFDLSKYITSIQVDLSVDSPPGSATINLSVPRHAIDDLFYDGECLITEMMEVEIFAKGYYLVEGLPQYYPIFWGLVTEVSDDYSGGEHTVTIGCADILKWWEICRMNVNAAFTAPNPSQGKSIFGNVFFGMNPYDVLYTLANMSFGDILVGTGSLTSFVAEAKQKQTFNAALGDIMAYWQTRFGKMRSNLLLYGVNGVAVRGDALASAYDQGKAQVGKPFASAAVRNANGGLGSTSPLFDPASPDVVAFRTQFAQAGQVNFWQSEYQTKLEIATAAKEAIGFEFYMDVTGDIVFKPPFYNLDILGNKPVSWVQDIDIIDWNRSSSIEEVVTHIQLQGNFGSTVEYGFGEEITPYTSVVDYHLLRKYGWRPHTYNSEFMSDPVALYYHGLDLLDRINCRRHRMPVTIPLRPEVRLGFPIYLEPRDQVWYVQGISHNIQFGGRATTSLSLTAKREKFKAPKGLASLKTTGEVRSRPTSGAPRPASPTSVSSAPSSTVSPLKAVTQKAFALDVGGAAFMPAVNADPDRPETMEPYEPLVLRDPKTGRVLGCPNVVMVYTRPFAEVGAEGFRRVAGVNKAGGAGQSAKDVRAAEAAKTNERLDTFQRAFNETIRQTAVEKYAANRWRYGLNSAGVFVYAHDASKAITQAALLPARNIDVTGIDGGTTGLFGQTKNSAFVRPISDARGFEVVGHYPYGRGVALRDGSLVRTEGGANTRAAVDVQVALAGDLSSTLRAQSQGLVRVSTGYADPADVLARLQPDDLRTAAFASGGDQAQPSPEIVSQAPNFVETAPLGSAAQAGAPPSVEASQLSRALTLTEMTVRGEGGAPLEDACACVLGRADLAFLNLAPQVQPLRPTAGDTSLLPNPSVRTLDLGGPVVQAPQRLEQVQSTIEAYLYGLYRALDDQHVAYEQELRGGTSTNGGTVEDPDLFAAPPPTSAFDPPFSPSGRAALGDPEALALQGDTAAGEFKSRWKSFGENLRKGSR